MKLKPFKNILCVIVFLSVILSVFAISYFRLLDNYELETLDIRFLLRPKIPTTDKIVIIEIGEDTIEKLGRFPFDRSYHALMVKALSEADAKYILFDIFFSETCEDDKEFEDALKNVSNVYLPYVLDINPKEKSNVLCATGYRATTLEAFRFLAKGEGHINIIPDNDGKFRRVPVYIKYKGILHPFMSFLMTCDYLGIREKDVKFIAGRYLECGKDLRIPLDENSNMIINFSGKWSSTYKHYSYKDILQSYLADISAQKPILDLTLFKDKICIISLTAAGTSDLHPNPFEPLYPATGIHAEIFNSILNRKFITRLSQWSNLFVLALLSILTSIASLKTKPIKGLLALISTVGVFLFLSVILFNLFGIWMDVICPVLMMGLVYLAFTLYKYVVEWKKRLVLENELEIAKKIQESFLPKTPPSIKGVDVAAAMFTARQVGGDLYDFIEFDKERLGVMIGDVSGKGIPASLFMAMTIGTFRSFAMSQVKPKDVLLGVNSKLFQESMSNSFVTIFYSIFDIKNRVLNYANGGHFPALYLSKGKKSEFLNTEEGLPLGLMDSQYSEEKLSFDKEDIFVFYTDGVTEAMNLKSDMYGRHRLAAVVEKNRNSSSKELIKAIEKDLRKFEPELKQHDDITIIVVKIV
ncbi:MAG: CHASE2 domain-containing protein [Candidatus Omnitrophica bacterium]|nr:CHASE2 domain-containing protein [Candidatus Omnitrophota bacterium]